MSIDRAVRVVIPTDIRDRLAFDAVAEHEIDTHGDTSAERHAVDTSIAIAALVSAHAPLDPVRTAGALAGERSPEPTP